MNTDIHNAFVSALLADTCYVEGLLKDDTGSVLAGKLTSSMRMPDRLSAYIGDNFNVVTQYTNPDPLMGGLSVTVFEERSSGQRYISFRGTEPNDPRDLATDADVEIGSGLAQAEVLDLANWYQRVTSPSGSEIVQVKPSLLPLTYESFAGNGDGSLLVNGQKYTGKYVVSGHSLGGHLTTVFSRLFAQDVATSNTFNGLGVGGLFSGQQKTELLLGQIETLLGIGNTAWPSESRQNNYWAEHGINVTTTEAWLQQYGFRIPVFNEEGTGVPNHLLYKVTDALALCDAMGTLDNQLSLAMTTALLDAGSAQPVSSLESILDSLRKLLLNQTSRTQIGDAGDSPSSRIDYQANLADLRTFAEANQNLYRIAPLTTQTASNLTALAKSTDANAIAYRYALKEQNPFAILGANYSAYQSSLALYDPATSSGTLTEAWLTDRAAMLAWMNQARTNDTAFSATQLYVDTPQLSGQTWNYQANDLDQSVLVRGTGSLNPNPDMHHVLFGTDNGGLMQGGDYSDRLYGMGGDDTMNGKAGADYLEGGSGNDTYIIAAGDGNDTLLDTDGNGSLQIAGITLDGGDYIGPGAWKKDDIAYTFTPAANGRGRLTIASSAGITTVENFANGNLGITLPDTPAASTPPPTATLTIVGDLTPVDTTEPYSTDALGNIIVDPTLAAPGRNDLLYDSLGNDRIVAGGGDDIIIAHRDGDDSIEGGDGSDGINGGPGNDLIEGGAGPDFVTGGSGDDRLYVNASLALATAFTDGETQATDPARGEILNGDDGRDQIVGGATADVLWGGGGEDTLIGGGGDDILRGDSNASGQERNWTVTRTVTSVDGEAIYRDDYTGVFTTALANGAADVLYGGAGDDWLFGETGNDLLDGGIGTDILFGGDDNDTLLGKADNDVLDGEIGHDFLDGGEGDDSLHGGASSDLLYGGDGIDYLIGDDRTDAEHGDDILHGENGNDNLIGGGGADTLYGDAGDDQLNGDIPGVAGSLHGDDTLDGGDGNDALSGDGGNDTLLGGIGNDILQGDGPDTPAGVEGDDILDGGAGDDNMSGNGGNDQLTGGAGDDDLFGGDGNDILSGGSGTDTLNGGLGDDTYVIATGDAQLVAQGASETLIDTGGRDTLRMDGITALQVAPTSQGGTVLVIDAGSDRIAIVGGLAGAIDSFETDGQTLSPNQLVGRYSAAVLMGTDALGNAILLGGLNADTLTSSTDAATLSGGRGNDTLSATGNNNRILYGVGDGTDHVTTGGTGNTLVLGPGIASSQLALGLGSLALRIGDNPTDVIHFDTFNPGDTATGRPFDTIELADDSTLSYTDLLQRGIDVSGTSGNDTLIGTDLTDRIDGGAGDDALRGGVGSDTYRWGRGSGRDTIDNTDTSSGKTDTLQMGAGLTPGDIVLTPNGNDLVIRLLGTTDQVTVTNHFTGAPIDRLLFEDGTAWDVAAIQAHLGPNELTEGPDLFTGTVGNDVINALGGDDTVNGLAGDDVIDGGAGDDALRGGDGNDTLNGGTGFNVLYGDDGNDSLRGGGTLFGGNGDDLLEGGVGTTMYGGAGNDVFTFRRTYSIDTTLVCDDWAAGAVDAVSFAADITPANIKLNVYQSTGLAVIVTDPGTTASSSLLIKNYFSANANPALDELRFADGTTWTYADVLSRMLTGTTGNDSLSGPGTNDTMHGLGGDDWVSGGDGNDTVFGDDGNDTIFGKNGDDVLIGGTGTDLLYGEFGNDTYRFGRGDGQDVIDEDGDYIGTGDPALNWGTDTLELGPGITESDVLLYHNNNDLYVVLDQSATQMRIYNHFNSSPARVENIQFANGPIWSVTDINTRAVNTTTNGVTGTAGIDTLETDGSATLGADIENLTLTGLLNSYGKGNALNNVLVGNRNNNDLDGLAGADRLVGGAGDDTYHISPTEDTVVELPGEGNDTIFATLSYTLPADFENLTMTGGYVSLLYAYGNGLNNVIRARPNYVGEVIDGRGGADTMIGGIDTTFYVDNPGDVVRGAGNSRVIATVDWASTGQIKTIELAASVAVTATGDDGDNILIGNSNANMLYGMGGNDTLRGGVGADTLIGGAGNDTYELFATGGVLDDTITELAGEGVDTVVVTGASIDLVTIGSQLENATLASGAGAYALYGDASSNVLTGNDGNNVLDGRGGADIMKGGAGSDTYYIDDVGDQIIDSGGGTIHASISYALNTAGTLILEGTSALTATGTAQADQLDGSQNTAANQLIGGAGNDSYVVGVGDVVVENPDEGVDMVNSATTLTLAQNLENGRLTGNANVDLIGNAVDNALTGNDGDNLIHGGDGNDTITTTAGNDQIDAGAGNDIIIVENSSRTIIVGNGDPNDVDTLRFLVPRSAMPSVRTGNDLVFGSLGQITIRDFFVSGSQPAVDRIEFSDGTVLVPADFVVNELNGTEGADILTGSNGPDQIRGLGGDDQLAGGGGDDSLDGGTGNDTLDGGTGTDTLTGGLGNDSYILSDATDTVLELPAEGYDTVYAAINQTLQSNVEKLILTGSAALQGYGNALDNELTGNSGNNLLYGLVGNDLLDGGAGADYMDGGAGDDIYIVDSTQDNVNDTGGGNDTVRSSVSYGMAGSIENLVLTGTAAINATGDVGDNVITGNTAANTLSGGGGNDTYIVSTGDTVTESSNAGTDTVMTDIAWTLGSNIEKLVLTGTANINGTGNTLANQLTGNVGNNVLSGGTGADSLSGGLGDDTYVVDNTADLAIENANEGTDLVQSSVTFTVGANIEKLTLTGSSAINGTGNELDNVLTGNSGANRLTGGAGNDRLDGAAGKDTMIGGAGNDIYVVDVSTDVITESLNEGTDSVESKVTLTLGSNVENLTLTGTSAINGTGNTLDNVLIGNSAVNTLTGGAGNDTLDGAAGADKLIGGAGNDTYGIDNASDTITENANEGTDTVKSTLTYTLATNLENLTLLGTSAINGTGNTVANLLVGNSAANTLTGNAGNDTLDGGAGTDSLVGGTGNDTYQFGLGYGTDTVTENDATVGNTDVARFMSGIATDQIWLRHVGNNLELSIIGTSDKLTIQNWYTGSAYHVEQFQTADNKQLIDTRVENLVQAMASFAPPAAGQTTLPQNYQDVLASVIAANWQ